MSDESGFVTSSRVGQHCQQQQQHPLASLASSVQGVHLALAGRPVQSRARLPSPRQQQQQLAFGQPNGSEPSLQNPMMSSSPSAALPQHPGNDSPRSSRAAGLIFATVPGATNILASAEEQPLLLLSDTVSNDCKHRQASQIRDQPGGQREFCSRRFDISLQEQQPGRWHRPSYIPLILSRPGCRSVSTS